MKKTISLLLVGALLSSCASQPYRPYYGNQYYPQPVYRGYDDSYRSQTTYADSGSGGAEDGESSNAALWVLGGIVAAGILLGGDASDSSSAGTTSSWSDGQEAAYRREENARAAAQGNVLPYPGE